MTARRPHLRGILNVRADLDQAQRDTLAAEFARQHGEGGGQVMAVSADTEWRHLDWSVPDAQAAFTLRSIMAAQHAAAGHLARLQAAQDADARAAADVGTVGGQLGHAARVERRRAEITAAQAREAEVRAELAEAHARATGRMLPPPNGVSLAGAYGPGSISADPGRAAREAAGAVVEAGTELAAAQHAERAARERLTRARQEPHRLHVERVRYLRRRSTLATGLAVGGALAGLTGFPAVVPVVLISIMVAVILLGLTRIAETEVRVRRAHDAIPGADADHDTALRRLVAAEAGMLAAGGEVTPSTLDTDVEAAAAAPVPLAWG